jgi:hypothetical protein
MSAIRKSGRKNLPPDELRTHCVSVRLNNEELSFIDAVRDSGYQRGEMLRILALYHMIDPKIVPELNKQVALDLRRALGNLSTVATAMRGGEYVQIDVIREALNRVRQLALGLQ